MCGIAGVVTWEDRFRATRETLAAISASIAHRGPDGEGAWLNHDSAVTSDRPRAALLHRRLAVLDTNARANQPFTNGVGCWIVFNGEIYNFRPLREELTALRPGYLWRTQCDTEVLLLAYDVWGEDSLSHLNGMFAFAIWNDAKKHLFLARDRMGQKPLYYADAPSGGAFAFASELPALFPLKWIDRNIREAGVTQYLRRGQQTGGATIYAGIRQLPPGHWMTRGGTGPTRPTRYFNANVGNRELELLPESGIVKRVRHTVLRAVDEQLISDVPLGVFLSGGMDSSVIAAAAARSLAAAGRTLDTFSIGFDDPRYDESAYARSVAAFIGARHHRFVVQPDAAEDLVRLAAVFGEPFADSSALPTHYLSRETRRHVTVALSGDGGDELFGGYDRYRALATGETLKRLLPATLLRLLARSSRGSGAPPKSLSARLHRFLRTLELDPAQRYLGYGEIFPAAMVTELFPSTSATEDEFVLQALFECLRADRDTVSAALALDRVAYLPDDLLVKVDRCSMIHALEVRSPFLDHELVHLAAQLNRAQLLRGGKKRMLRLAFAGDLPAWVFRRRKMGFAVPIGQWFRGPLRAMLTDHLLSKNSFAATHFQRGAIERLLEEHQGQTRDHSQRLYALLMLELWWRRELTGR